MDEVGFGALIRENAIVRLLYAGWVAGRILAGYRLIALGAHLGLVRDREAAVRRLHQRGARQVYRGVVRLQGLMIKIGQTIGSNPAAIPMEYISVLSRLQDAVPPHPWAEMRPALERALGSQVDRVFAHFDRRPVGAASLAQVYRARMHDGREVAVKVLYPNISRLVYSDLRVLRLLLALDSRFGGYPLDPIYDELAANIPLEIDLLHEAAAMEAMARDFAHDPRVVIPKVVHELSSRTVLVMEWIDGIKVTDVARVRAAGIDVQRIADAIVDCWCQQMLVNGFFHADPHPGNIFALRGDRIGIVDFGLTKRMTPQFTRSLRKLNRTMFTGDLPHMIEAYEELGFAVTRSQDIEVYRQTAAFFTGITDASTLQAGPEAMRGLNERWAAAVKANPFVAIPGDMTLVSRVFSLMTGVGAAMGADPKVLPAILRYTESESERPAAAQ